MIDLRPAPCAICGTHGNAAVIYPQRIDGSALDGRVFSARRAPDGLHFRFVRCRACGLLRSDPVAPAKVLAQLYAASTFDETEVRNLRRTYGQYLSRLDRHAARKGDLLEIGCGTGFFLEESVARGYRHAVGVEPSRSAAERPPADPRIEIVTDVMREGLFPPRSFDVVCLFQTLDHLPDPGLVLDLCREVLRPDGLLLALNHDAAAWSARLLGERSPIVDVEHTYLFDRATMRRIVADRGFDVLEVGRAYNAISLRYAVHLSPLPPPLRRPLLAALGATGLARLALWLPLGNLFIVGRTPSGSRA